MERDRTLSLVRAVCALIAALCPLASAQYGGGSGADDDPYLIYTAEQLNAIGAEPNDWANTSNSWPTSTYPPTTAKTAAPHSTSSETT
ncbi:MAG: hypothetical protein JW741_01450 [Sedimentisphaerales bacterium]|nr:hypothetical protein [Sedimentisphaerales bacterium]